MTTTETRRPAVTGERYEAPTSSSVMPMPCLTTTLALDSEPGAVRSRVSQTVTSDAILLATDGSAGAADAVVVAMAIARQKAIPLQILTVVEPMPLGLDDDLGMLPLVEFLQMREDEAHLRVRRQIHDVIGKSEPIGINVEFGKAAGSIERLAGEWKARLVVLGFGLRERSGRWGAGATTRSVASEAPVATLAVATGHSRIPRVIVVGIDFSDVSIAAAREAVAISDRNAIVHLVLVRPAIGFPQDDANARITLYEQGVQSLFDKLTRQLRELGGQINFRTTLASGAVDDALRQAAVSTGADVIAVGRRGHHQFDHFWMGSVTESLLRDTPCSVLVAPPPVALPR